MLRSYFNHMFDKVVEDGLLTEHPDGQSAVFHTGLLTRSEQDIYAVFVPNEREDAQDWFFRGFSTRDGIGLGDLLALRRIASAAEVHHTSGTGVLCAAIRSA